MTHKLLALVLPAALIVAASCTATKKQPTTAPLAADMTQFSGGILVPATRPAAISAPTVAPVKVELLLLPKMPRNVLQPFSTSSKLLTGIGGDAALLAVPESLALARLGYGADAQWLWREARAGTFGQATDLGSFTGLLAPGVSLRCSLNYTSTRVSDLQIVLEQPSSGPEALQVGLVATSVAVSEEEDNQQPAPRLETAVATVPVDASRTEVSILVPRPSGTVLAHITLSSRGTGVTDAELASAQAQLEASAQHSPVLSAQQLLIQASIAAMKSPETRRAAISNLASQSQATLCQDVAASANDQTLESLANLYEQVLPKAPAGEIGWTMDHTTFDYLAKLRIGGKLPPDLDTVLTVFAGEAGHSVASMEQLVDKKTTRQNLHERLIAENYIYLEDTSPSSRVRAYDWLKAEGKAPPGYDPMGPPQQRRKALDAAIESMTNPTPANPSTQSPEAAHE